MPANQVPMPEPAINIERIGIDFDRLERSLGLRAERIGPGRFRIDGGEHTHWVDLYTTDLPRCDCADHLWRERICKHILAALLREGNEQVLAALRQLVAALRSLQLAA
jgi:SWIM zinc finger